MCADILVIGIILIVYVVMELREADKIIKAALDAVGKDEE